MSKTAEKCTEELVRKFESLWGMPLALRLEKDAEKAARDWKDNASRLSLFPVYGTFVDIEREADGRKCTAELRETWVPEGDRMSVRLEWALTDKIPGKGVIFGLEAIGRFLAECEPEEDAEAAGYRRVAEFLEGQPSAGEEDGHA